MGLMGEMRASPGQPSALTVVELNIRVMHILSKLTFFFNVPASDAEDISSSIFFVPLYPVTYLATTSSLNSSPLLIIIHLFPSLIKITPPTLSAHSSCANLIEQTSNRVQFYPTKASTPA